MMARPERISLEVPSQAGAGAPAHVFRLRDKTVQVGGTFVATLQLEGSLGGGADFAPIGAPITAPGLFTIPMTVELVRIRVAQITSGTPMAAIAGFDERAL